MFSATMMQLPVVAALLCHSLSGQTLKFDTSVDVLDYKPTQLILEDIPWSHLLQNTTRQESLAAVGIDNSASFPFLDVFHDGPNATGRTQRIIRRTAVLQKFTFAKSFKQLDMKGAEALIRKPKFAKTLMKRTSLTQSRTQTTAPVCQADAQLASARYQPSLDLAAELETTSAAPNTLVALSAWRTFSKMVASLAAVFLIFLFWL